MSADAAPEAPEVEEGHREVKYTATVRWLPPMGLLPGRHHLDLRCQSCCKVVNAMRLDDLLTHARLEHGA